MRAVYFCFLLLVSSAFAATTPGVAFGNYSIVSRPAGELSEGPQVSLQSPPCLNGICGALWLQMPVNTTASLDDFPLTTSMLSLLTYTNGTRSCVGEFNVTFVTNPSPSTDGGEIKLSYICP